MEKRKLNTISIVMYVFAALFAVYALYALVEAVKYISEMVSVGYITVATSFGDIINYTVTATAAYIFYALGCYGIGYVINVLVPGAVKEEKVIEAAAEDAPVEETAEVIAETEEAVEAEVEEAVEEMVAAEAEKIELL